MHARADLRSESCGGGLRPGPSCVLLLALLCALSSPACRLDADVDQAGDYTFFPSSNAADTDARPLQQLLVIEQYDPEQRTLFTLLRGELGEAGIGLEDLRVIATRHGGFQMNFETAVSRRLEAARDLADDDDRERLSLEVDGEPVRLFELDADTRAETGASRWLRTLESRDFDVRAFVGVAEIKGTLRELRVDGRDHALGALLTAALAGTAPELEHDGELEQFSFDPGIGSGPDYLQIDFLQRIERVEGDLERDGDGGADDDGGAAPMADTDASPDAGARADAGADAGVGAAPLRDFRESMVRTTLPPGAIYEGRDSMLTDAFGQGCWSRSQPLHLRVTQVARDYVVRGVGDLAIIHRRAETVVVPKASWQPSIGDAVAASYCESYVPAP